ncbi:hypothetical protein FNX48_012260 [Streptomyces sp. IF17]|nr:hypothetical protein [Streptomyces alkaliphilus]
MAGLLPAPPRGRSPALLPRLALSRPLFSPTFEGNGRPVGRDEVRETVADAVRRETTPGAGNDHRHRRIRPVPAAP